MGVVYLAKHKVLDRLFAVKLLRRELVGDGVAQRRFEREARIASAVMQHPNIVQIYDCGHTRDGQAYLVMEYVDGLSLHALAVSSPDHQLHLSQAVDITMQILHALAAAHARGIVHRDVKPENILLTYRNGQPEFVKVTDFGVARMVGEQRLTADGCIVGTPLFVAPEMISGNDVGPPADVYAVGIMLHELVVGSAPWGGSMNAVLNGHLSQVPLLLSQRRPDAIIPKELDLLVARLLAKVPGERPSAEDAASLLMQIRPLLPPRSVRSLLVLETLVLGVQGGKDTLHDASTLILSADGVELPRSPALPLGSGSPSLLHEMDQLDFEMERSSRQIHRLAMALIRRRWPQRSATPQRSGPPAELLRQYQAIAESEQAEVDLGVRMALLRSEAEKDAQQADSRRAEIHAEMLAVREELAHAPAPRKTQQKALTKCLLDLERAYAEVAPEGTAVRELSRHRARLHELQSEIQQKRRALAVMVLKRCSGDVKVSSDSTLKAACRGMEKALREFDRLDDAMKLLLERLPTYPQP
jgi:serine/threonine protein kinase